MRVVGAYALTDQGIGPRAFPRLPSRALRVRVYCRVIGMSVTSLYAPYALLLAKCGLVAGRASPQNETPKTADRDRPRNSGLRSQM